MNPLYIATLGWEHEGWSGSFYPDDLPAAWRLTYYASEFHAVVIPAGIWQAAGPDTWRQWQVDVPAGFWLFLEAAGAPPPAARVALLGDNYGGLAGGEEFPLTRWEGGMDLTGLRRIIEEMPQEGILLVAGAPPLPEVMRAAQTLAGLLGQYA